MCYNPAHVDFDNYGGRGIKVCKSWLKFETFLEEMGERPEGKTLVRKDITKDYYKSNCGWSACRETVEPISVNDKLLTYGGVTQTISQWSIDLGIPCKTIRYRLENWWSVDKVMTKPVQKRKAKR